MTIKTEIKTGLLQVYIDTNVNFETYCYDKIRAADVSVISEKLYKSMMGD